VGSDSRGRESLQVIIDELLIASHWMPLEVRHTHLLAGAIVNSAKNVHRVVVELRAV